MILCKKLKQKVVGFVAEVGNGKHIGCSVGLILCYSDKQTGPRESQLRSWSCLQERHVAVLIRAATVSIGIGVGVRLASSTSSSRDDESASR